MSLSTDQQNRLGTRIQQNIPFVSAPFAQIAEELGVTQGEVLAQLSTWQEEKVLREISAVLEGSVLGYESALVAARVPDTQLEQVAAVISAHPTVTHNYQRDHEYNLWFTLAMPEEMGLDPALAILSGLTGVEAFYPLRRTHTFKIGVNFDLESMANNTEQIALGAQERKSWSPEEKKIFRALQTHLPLVERPFEQLARHAGLPEPVLLEFARKHLGGAIRRYMATFRHRKLGVKGNGMVVWAVPLEQLESIGTLAAAQPEVSHCYARNPAPGFPYTLYTMIHGRDEEACRLTAERIAQATGNFPYRILFSTREFKKVRLRYFLSELDAWWAAQQDAQNTLETERTRISAPGERGIRV